MSRKQRKSLQRYPQIAGLLLCLGITFFYILSTSFASGSSSPPFSLLVTLVFTSVEHKEQFLQFMAPLAKYVKEHEPGTIAYEVLQSDQNELQVMILERYKDKENAYAKVHKSSEQFLEFRPKLKALQDAGHVTIEGHSYVDTSIGFGDRVSKSRL